MKPNPKNEQCIASVRITCKSLIVIDWRLVGLHTLRSLDSFHGAQVSRGACLIFLHMTVFPTPVLRFPEDHRQRSAAGLPGKVTVVTVVVQQFSPPDAAVPGGYLQTASPEYSSYLLHVYSVVSKSLVQNS